MNNEALQIKKKHAKNIFFYEIKIKVKHKKIIKNT